MRNKKILLLSSLLVFIIAATHLGFSKGWRIEILGLFIAYTLLMFFTVFSIYFIYFWIKTKSISKTIDFFKMLFFKGKEITIGSNFPPNTSPSSNIIKRPTSQEDDNRVYHDLKKIQKTLLSSSPNVLDKVTEQSLYLEGCNRKQQGKPNEALICFIEHKNLEPNDISNKIGLALLLVELAHNDLAKRIMDQAIKINRVHPLFQESVLEKLKKTKILQI